jgi:hypothetical protein
MQMWEAGIPDGIVFAPDLKPFARSFHHFRRLLRGRPVFGGIESVACND